MSAGQALYGHLPVAAQHALVTLYGYLRARKRYGGEYAAILQEIDSARHLDAAALCHLRHARLAAMLEHAARHVPYYRERAGALGPITPDTLRRFPVLSKQEVRRHGPQFRADGMRPYWSTETSGSTGTPLTIHLDAYAYKLSMALVASHEAEHGIGPRARRATFAGRLVQPVDDDRPPFWRYNHAERQMLFSTYHMSDRHLPAYLDALERFRPAEIIGYPSAIAALADFCRRSGRRVRLALEAVVTNSETLWEWQRTLIETHLGAPVFDYYGTAESVVFAGQCRHGRYHVDPLMGLAEVLDEAGRPVPPGASGRLVCTTLSNRMMPLIRYEIGDTVTFAGDSCPCGRTGPVFASIVGRTDDVVVTPEGRQVGRLDHVFKGTAGIREAQIAQVEPARLVIRVVPGEGYTAAVAEAIIRNTRERVGSRMEVGVEVIAAVPRTARGKFRGVVRECGSRA